MRATTAILALATLAAAIPALAHDGDPKYLDRAPAWQGQGWRNSQRAAGPNIAALGVTPAFARSNVTLLAWMPLSDFGVPASGNGNSLTGYVSPSGREYAIFGHSNGTAIVEVTQPTNPVIVEQIAGPLSLWRDMRTYGQYAYAVSEGGGGIQVIDLTQVDAGTVTLANTILTGGDARTHTLAVNATSGRLIRAGGAGNGLRIYDLTADPASPLYLGAWPDRYVHEAQVVTYPTGGPGNGPRELAICNGGLNGGWTEPGIDVVDITNAAMPVSIGHFPYPTPGYSHQSWLSPDRTRLYHNDETDLRPFTRVFDATNLNSATPTLPYLDEFQNGVTVDHNLYTKGSLIYESNYRSGLRVFDTTSGATTPTLVAWFDTYPEDDDVGYRGLWNNYPYLPSGIVLGSDLQRGLFVWWVGTPQLEITFPRGTPALLNPAGDVVEVRIAQHAPASLQPGSAKLWRSTGGAWSASALAPLGGDRWGAVFPPIPCGSDVRWYVEATSTNGIVWTSPELAPDDAHESTVAFGVQALASADFEASSQGFARDVATDTATSGLWTRADPLGTGPQSEDDHTGAPGVNCWFTGQGASGAGPETADVDGGRTRLLSPVYDVSGRPEARVRYWRWYSNDEDLVVDDSFRVEASSNGGSSWVSVETLGPGHAEASGGWFAHTFRVADVVPVTSQFRLRFWAEDVGSDSIVEAAIDDVLVYDPQCSGHAPFCAGDGSALACPCGNVGQSGAGCASSLGFGATLAGGGVPSVAADTFSLQAGSVGATAPVLFFQGTQMQSGGVGATFGDGLRCATGTVVRLAIKIAQGGQAKYPVIGEVAISVRGGVSAGDARAYQAWYRNAPPFCTRATFNLTNGVSVVWGG